MQVETIYEKCKWEYLPCIKNCISKGQVYMPYIGRKGITGFPPNFKNLQIPGLFAKARS